MGALPFQSAVLKARPVLWSMSAIRAESRFNALSLGRGCPEGPGEGSVVGLVFGRSWRAPF